MLVTAGVTGAGLALPLLGASGASAADAATWDKVAECESGGLWSANEGNGYYGGLQLTQQTWEQYGGTDFADRPDLASRGQQITVAEKILDAEGPEAWPSCSAGAGLDAGDQEDPGVDPGSILDPPLDLPSPGEDTPTPGGDGTTDDATPVPGDSTPPTGDPSNPPTDDATSPGEDTSGEPTEAPTDDTSADPTAPGAEDPSQNPSGDASDAPSDGSPEGDGGDTAPGGHPGQGGDAEQDQEPSQPGTGKHRGEPAEDGGHPSGEDGGDRDGHPSRGGKHARPGTGVEVRPGDSLSRIAAEHDVEGGWAGLYERNERTVGADPDLILPGQHLTL
ncbi:transglycosylase family protein [Streptomyces sp. HNM0574]|uniref:transglycosylase family protein n=1 Tax=Streptomyces sp. HNM0574 TaxID=2714954 RepID=UPI0032167BB8